MQRCQFGKSDIDMADEADKADKADILSWRSSGRNRHSRSSEHELANRGGVGVRPNHWENHDRNQSNSP